MPLRLLALLLSLPGLCAAQCALQGHVQLPRARTTPVMTKRYEIVSKGGILSTNPPVAIVYLEGSFPAPAKLPVQQMIQKDFMFTPALLPVQKGTKVEFPNLDDTYHNVFSYSPAKRFDLGRYLPNERPIPAQVLDKPGMITLRCDIHEHMRAIILVLDTPHFSVTGTDGAFQLKNLPPGTFTLKAWVNSRVTQQKQVELKPGAPVTVNFP